MNNGRETHLGRLIKVREKGSRNCIFSRGCGPAGTSPGESRDYVEALDAADTHTHERGTSPGESRDYVEATTAPGTPPWKRGTSPGESRDYVEAIRG